MSGARVMVARGKPAGAADATGATATNNKAINALLTIVCTPPPFDIEPSGNRIVDRSAIDDHDSFMNVVHAALDNMDDADQHVTCQAFFMPPNQLIAISRHLGQSNSVNALDNSHALTFDRLHSYSAFIQCPFSFHSALSHLIARSIGRFVISRAKHSNRRSSRQCARFLKRLRFAVVRSQTANGSATIRHTRRFTAMPKDSDAR